jgi:hypothetical protein
MVSVVSSNLSNNKKVKQFRLATYAHEAARNSRKERDAANIIKEKIQKKNNISEGVRVTEEIINGSKHVFTAVPAKCTDLPPETGDVAVVPNMDMESKSSDRWHVAVVTAKDARNL